MFGQVLCDWCGRPVTGAYSIQHRLPGKMGGRVGKHTPEATCLLHGTGTTECHGWAESVDRKAAYAVGLLVREGWDPASTPMLRHGVRWEQPTGDLWVPVPPPEAGHL